MTSINQSRGAACCAHKNGRGFEAAAVGSESHGLPAAPTTDPVADSLAARFPGFVPDPGWSAAAEIFPPLAPAEYLARVQQPRPSDPVFRQLAPSGDELAAAGGDDPVGEEEFEAVPGLLHRYPDRALLLVTANCFVRCRHCMRKRRWADRSSGPTAGRVQEWRAYLAAHTEVREIILSGGDPLTLSDRELGGLLRSLRSVRPPRSLRVHSRALAAVPSRITPRLASLLAENGVARFVTQVNHPAEISDEVRAAAARLADAGIAVENQSVLLRGVNDSAETLADLFAALTGAGIRPYYLHHPDPVRGAMHFHLSLDAGLAIWRSLQATYRGPLPEYVVDVPGRKGKRKVEEIRK